MLNWLSSPSNPSTNRRNFLNVQLDGIGVGLASAAAPFLPVFLARLGATNFQVGLLTSMPAVTGFLLSILLGNFLQTRHNIIPWFTLSRTLNLAAYTLTGLVTLLFPNQNAVTLVLLIWAAATLPQAVISITFSVVMNAVAGPAGRFELMSRRWALLGTVTALGTLLAGQALNLMKFPHNFELVFIVLSSGMLLSYYFSSRIVLPEQPHPPQARSSIFNLLRANIHQVWQEKPFIRIVAKRFVFLTGVTLGIPLFPLFYVRVVHASNGWIGIFSTAQTAVLVIGYFFWSQMSRRRDTRWILRIATFGISLYPAMIAFASHEIPIALISGASGIFQAGIDLVFFDELMRTIPEKYSPSFVSFDQSLQYIYAIAAPLLGTLLADAIGIERALLISAVIRLVGFVWFALDRPKTPEEIPEKNQEIEPSH